MQRIHSLLLTTARLLKLRRQPGPLPPNEAQVLAGRSESRRNRVIGTLLLCLPLALSGGCGGSDGENSDSAAEEQEQELQVDKDPAPPKEEPDLFSEQQLEMLTTRYYRGGGNPLHSAVRDGYVNRVKQLLDAGFEADEQSLSIASSQGNVRTVRLLLEAGAPPTGSMYVALDGGHAEVVSLLLEAGGPADLTIRYRQSRDSRSLLEIAAAKGYADIVRRLLEGGAPVDMRAPYQETALHGAALYGQLDVVRVLLEWGADVNAQDKQTALHAAAIHGDEEVVRILLQAGASPDALTSASRETPLYFAAANGHENVVSLLLETGVSVDFPERFSRNPMHAAVRARDSEIVRQLLEAGAAANLTDNKGRLPIQLAASHGSAEITALLLKAGVPADMSALVTAADLGHADVARLLMDAGASVLGQDRGRNTMLHYAARAGHAEVVNLFLSAGAPVDVRNDSNYTPICDAVIEGVSPFRKADQGKTEDKAAIDNYVEVIRLLINAGGPLNWRCWGDQSTLLHIAAGASTSRFVKVLLEGGAAPDLQNENGETPLHIAARGAHDSSGVEMVRLLLEAGAAVDTTDNEGLTALDWTANNLEAWRLIKDWAGN